MNYFRLTALITTSFLLAACGGENSDGPQEQAISKVQASSTCSRTDIENNLTNQLANSASNTDFIFYLEDHSGEAYSYQQGDVTLNTPFESASTSKWVSTAVILQVVDRGLMSLNDHPQDLLPENLWNLPEDSPLNDITLSQLLSFTSGLDQPLLCDDIASADFFQCVSNIADNHLQSNNPAGSSFHYGSNHLQVAGAMAIEAGGYQSWLELFNEFKAVTGLFSHSYYNLPSENNPRLAGGMTWTAADYIDFIRAFRDADIYSSYSPVELATTDQLANTSISYSPAMEQLGEDWHYGYGLWIECHGPTFEDSCANAAVVSSPGAYGAYPFLNTANDSFGLIARQGSLGTFKEGYELFSSVRNLVDEWVACE